MPEDEIKSIIEATKVGWAKAKGDIDWVDDSRKYKE
jgi:hypothetical protein